MRYIGFVINQILDGDERSRELSRRAAARRSARRDHRRVWAADRLESAAAAIRSRTSLPGPEAHVRLD
jgi:hypothetical protein